MKIFFKNGLTILVIMVMLLACQEDEPEMEIDCTPYVPQISDQYDFPVRPGMPEWKDLESYEEMLEVLQLPDSIIETISTPGLIETCFDYPLLNNILASFNLQLGIEQQMADFNGFQELSIRSEAGPLMLDRYEQMSPECFPKQGTSEEQGTYSLRFIHVAMVMSQPVFLEMLTDTERITLVSEALKKYDSMLKFPNLYGLLSLYTQAYIMTQIMWLDEYTSFVKAVEDNERLKGFMTSARFDPDTELQDVLATLDLIVEMVISYAR